MKVLVYSLLLVNFVVFAWFSWFGDDNEPVLIDSGFQVDESLPQLTLASEVNALPDGIADDLLGSPREGIEQATDAFLATDRPDSDDNIAGDLQTGNQALLANTTDSGIGDLGTGVDSMAAESDVLDSGLLPTGETPDTSINTEPADSLVTAIATEPLCVSLGPFQDDQFVSTAADLLAQDGYTTNQRATDGQVRVGFWVNIVAGNTRDDAQAVADQLRNRGVSDFYIVPGDTSNVISLGVYSAQERAQRRFDELTALGFDPVIDDRLQPGTVQWLDFSLSDPALINPADYVTGSGLPVELISRPCPSNDAASG